MLIVVAILTVLAWRRGWRWKALLPVGLGVTIMFTLGILVGLSVKASGGSFNQVDGLITGLGVLGDVAMIIALAIMISKAPKHVQAPVVVRPTYKEASVDEYLLEHEKPVAPAS